VTDQRSIIIFNHAISSQATKKSYFYQLKRFKEFYKIRDYDSLTTIEPKKLQVMIEDFVMNRSSKLESGSLRHSLSALELFFSMNDVVLNWKKSKKLIPKQERKKSGMKAYSIDDIRELIKSCKTYLHEVLIYVIASSGVRVGFVEDLKMKHLKDMPMGCKAITVHADTVYEHTTFMTPEASAKLERYFELRRKKGEKLTPESFVFITEKRRCYNAVILSTQLNRIARDSNIVRTKTHKNRYDIMSAHGLRKFFNTTLKLNQNLNPAIIERLLSHKSNSIPLDSSYFQPTEKDLFEVYQKAIQSLTIDKSSRLEFELEENKERLEKLENSKDRRILELESDVRLIKEFAKSIRKESS
jgi:integrase